MKKEISMKNLQINKIKCTLFEIELENVAEDKGGIGIRYSPNTINKHLRFAIQIYDNEGNVGEYVPPRGRAKVIMAASEALSYYIIGTNPLDRNGVYRKLRGL